jgi:Heterokaryon incompatibility protein (HET)
VDSLCIVQDDETTKTDYLNNMASIYAHATVTIIAAQGANADAGIRGIKRDATSQPRTDPITALTIGEEQMRFFIDWGWDGAWYDRAWTFQEGKFAGRRIFFEYGSAPWTCSQCEWYEEIYFHKGGERKDNRNALFSSDQKLFVLPFPNLDGYQDLVEKFCERQLTFEGDSLFAFAGMTSTLSQTFDGGFLCGLPELFFDNALLWTWIGSSKRKILPSDSVGIPSWSWAGWFDLKHYPSVNNWDASQDYVKWSRNENYDKMYDNDKFPKYQIYPILQWYSSNTISPKNGGLSRIEVMHTET